MRLFDKKRREMADKTMIEGGESSQESRENLNLPNRFLQKADEIAMLDVGGRIKRKTLNFFHKGGRLGRSMVAVWVKLEHLKSQFEKSKSASLGKRGPSWGGDHLLRESGQRRGKESIFRLEGK